MKTKEKSETGAGIVPFLLMVIIFFILMTAPSILPAVYAAPGMLDTTFNPGGSLPPNVAGLVTTDFNGTNHHGYGIALQTDQKIVVVGDTNGLSRDFAMARYNIDGVPDSSFGTGGKVTTDFHTALDPFVTTADQANAVAIQTDGKIVVVGGSESFFAVARYNNNGTLDTTFNPGGALPPGRAGLLTINFNDITPGLTSAVATAVALQTDGKIVVVGYVRNGSEFDDWVLARLNSDGTPDTIFNPGGVLFPGQAGYVVTSILSPEFDQAFGVAIQADKKIVVVGETRGTPGQFAMARYTGTGSLDITFGTGGTGIVFAATVKVNTAYAVAIQDLDQKIVVAGSQYVYDPNTINCSRPLSSSSLCEYPDFYVARYNTNGTLDNSFGTNGEVTTNNNPYGNADQGRAVAIQTNGKIVVAGWSETSIHDYEFPNPGQDNFTAINQFSLVRYAADGTLDTTFGTGGKVLTDNFPVGSTDDEINGVVIQTDGKIVVAGQTNSPSNFALARYDGDVFSPPPPSASPLYLPLIRK